MEEEEPSPSAAPCGAASSGQRSTPFTCPTFRYPSPSPPSTSPSIRCLPIPAVSAAPLPLSGLRGRGGGGRSSRQLCPPSSSSSAWPASLGPPIPPLPTSLPFPFPSLLSDSSGNRRPSWSERLSPSPAPPFLPPPPLRLRRLSGLRALQTSSEDDPPAHPTEKRRPPPPPPPPPPPRRLLSLLLLLPPLLLLLQLLQGGMRCWAWRWWEVWWVWVCGCICRATPRLGC